MEYETFSRRVRRLIESAASDWPPYTSSWISDEEIADLADELAARFYPGPQKAAQALRSERLSRAIDRALSWYLD